ncbi:MAG: hypothetical protein AAFV19_22230 [Pseudomonadota bacterium]
MLPGLILWDMFLLSLEILAEPLGLAAVAALMVVFAAARVFLGRYWQFQIALLLSLGGTVFIFAQFSTSAWGSGLMVFFLPSQIAIWGVYALIAIAAAGWDARRRA